MCLRRDANKRDVLKFLEILFPSKIKIGKCKGGCDIAEDKFYITKGMDFGTALLFEKLKMEINKYLQLCKVK